MRSSVLAVMPALMVCCVDENTGIPSQSTVHVGIRALEEVPGGLPDESITVTCNDNGVCEQIETVHEVIEPGRNENPGQLV